MHHKKIENQEIVFNIDDKAEEFFIIMQGSVDVYIGVNVDLLYEKE